MAVHVDKATKTYHAKGRDTYGLKNFSFQMLFGEMVALVGVSGSGKSTLLHTLGGLSSLDSGEARVGGFDVLKLHGDDLARFRRETAVLIFQEYNLLPMLTALENVAVVRYLSGETPNLARREALTALRDLGLENLSTRLPAQLSGGQRQRVAIARALAAGSSRHSIVLADEPTGSLDRETTAEVLAAFRHAAHSGSAVLIATHDPAVVEACDRVVEIRDGSNIASSN